MTEQEIQTAPVVKVARDLSAIVELAAGLHDQAIHKANDRLMPGGLAMVAMGAVASLDEWSEQYEAAEHRAFALGLEMPELDEDDSWEPPLQSLLFWSEQWRGEHGYPLPAHPTLKSESTFIRWALDWAWDNEPHFEDFARDINATVVRLENLLTSGVRPAFRGAPCMYDECRGKRLIRKTVPYRDENDEKAWRLTDWHCPNCKRQWSEEDYARNIYAAIERTNWLTINDESWCTVERAARHIERPRGTVASWATREQVRTISVPDDPRTFVSFVDVLARDQLAKERAAKRRVA